MSARSLLDISIGCDDFYKAKRFTFQGQYFKAEQTFKRVIKLRPDAASPHYHLGTVLFEQGSRKQAMKHFGKAACMKPDVVKYQNFHKWYGIFIESCNKQDCLDTFKKKIYNLLNELCPSTFVLVKNASVEQTMHALSEEISRVSVNCSDFAIPNNPDLNKNHLCQMLKYWKGLFVLVVRRFERLVEQMCAIFTRCQQN
eukprot:419169_1